MGTPHLECKISSYPTAGKIPAVGSGTLWLKFRTLWTYGLLIQFLPGSMERITQNPLQIKTTNQFELLAS